MKKNKEGVVKFEDECWNSFNPEAIGLAKAMLHKDQLERATARSALSHPWFLAQHSTQTRFPTTQEKMNKYNGLNRFKMEKIKPQFMMKYCAPLLQSMLYKSMTTYKTPQFSAKSIESRNSENVTEGRKVLNKMILVKTLNEEEEICKSEMNFKSEDIDEPSLELKVIATIELSVKHNKASIMPSNLTRKLLHDRMNYSGVQVKPI